MAKISLCMIAKDEEESIADAISSVLPVVDEIIVVDTGSKDKTKQIAEDMGAKVFDFKWQDDFSIARNESLSSATGDWILILDADEAIAESNLAGLKNLADSEENDAFIFTQRTYTNNTKLKDYQAISQSSKETKGFSGWVPSKIIRMFRNNKKIRLEGQVHETVKPSIDKMKGKIGETEIPIHHYSMLKDKSRKQAKNELYHELGKDKAKTGNAKALFELGKQQVEMQKYEDAIESFEQSIRADPENSEPYADLGTLYMRLGKSREAKQYLSKAINLNSQSYDAFNNLGAIYGMEGRHKDATLLFLKAIELNSEYASAYKNLGLTFDKLGKKEEAAKCFAVAIKLNPRYKDEIQFK